MKKEDQEKIITETEDEADGGFRERVVRITKGRFSNRRFVFVVFAITAVTVLAVILYLMFRTREEGRPVPAPRTTNFGRSNSGITGNTTITLTPEAVERAGIRIETVGEKLAAEETAAPTTGVVQANAYRETPVISLVGGVIRRVSAQLGENVHKGQTLAVVFSDELAASQSRFLALQTEAKTARQNYERAAQLVKISPASNTELDQALAALKIANAELEEHHAHHMRMAKLVEIGAASREEFEMATTKLRTAEAKVVEAKNRYDRAVKVAEINPVSRGEFEQAAVKRQTAESDLAATRERLLLLGLSPQRVNNLHSPSQITAEVALTAPVSGTVTSRTVNQGEAVEANKELMRVTDLSSVWAVAQVYEKDLGRVRTGSGATVTSNSYPREVFRGHVTYVDPTINQETRTAQVRVELDNPGQLLKIGMYVNVAFGSTGEAERTMPVVPSSAIQTVNGQQVVFLPTDQPNIFIMRPVRLVTESEGFSPVLEGLNVGDRIVTEGSFLLRAEFLKQNPNSQ